MRCPSCNSQNTRVMYTRRNVDDSKVYRRHECNECGYIFSTAEIYHDEYNKAKDNQRKLDSIAEFLLRGGR